MSVDTIIDDIIKAEGGYVDDKNDAGGKTCFGITELVAKANGYSGDMRNLPVALARSIYKQRYWLDPHFDRAAVLAPRVAEELMDMAVNMGQKTACVCLQECLNLLNRQGQDYVDISEDGGIGAGTLTALAALVSKRGEALLLKTILISRGARYLAIVKANPSQEAFAVGWITNRVHFTV